MKLFEKQFFDYKTELVNGDDVVDKNKTGMSFYDDFLTNDEKTIAYLKNSKNLEGTVVMMSPQEYFEACSKYGFTHQVSVEKLKSQRRLDKDTLNHLKDVLTIYKHKFPMPMLNKAENGQEGLHRMMVIGDMFGWDHKVPVLVVDWADKQRAFEQQKQARIQKIEYNIRKAVKQTLEYKFRNIEELEEQLQWELDKVFEYSDIETPVKFELTSDERVTQFTVTVGAASYSFDYEDVQFIDFDVDDELEIDDLDLEETEDFLRRYFGDDWRETHPHLKDIYHIDEQLEIDTYQTSQNDYIDVRQKVQKAWTRETCHPVYQGTWTREVPSTGQCAITAMYLNETKGWPIFETKVGRSRHFFNKDEKGNIVDLTSDQFNNIVDYSNSRERTFKELYKSCKDRYELFKHNIKFN